MSGAHDTGSVVERFDRTVDGWFDAWRGHPSVDAAFEAASRLGDWSLVWHLANVAQGLVDEQGPDRMVRNFVVLAFESALVNQGIKRLFRRGRPTADPDVLDRIRTPTTSSFPSGHASAAFTAAGLLGESHPAWRAPLYATAVVVACSRIHTRTHHASDVVAGAAVGWGLARAARRWWPAP